MPTQLAAYLLLILMPTAQTFYAAPLLLLLMTKNHIYTVQAVIDVSTAELPHTTCLQGGSSSKQPPQNPSALRTTASALSPIPATAPAVAPAAAPASAHGVHEPHEAHGPHAKKHGSNRALDRSSGVAASSSSVAGLGFRVHSVQAHTQVRGGRGRGPRFRGIWLQ